MSFEKAVHAKAVELARLSIEMTTAAGSGHPSTALSLAHLTAVLMYHQMRWDPKDPWNLSADRLVLSEGHAVPIVYAAYTDLGGVIGRSREDARPMTREDAMSLRAIESPIDGHPHPQAGFPFFDAATGSLGQGLSVAAGLAAAARMDGRDRNIYCIIGDGEAREGQIWEAVDFIADHGLTNVVAIFNCNELGQSDWVSPQQSWQTIEKKLLAYGFMVDVIDGHDPRQIQSALSDVRIAQNGKRPLAIVARTIKGWGSASEQGMGKHGTPVKKDQMKQIIAELDQTLSDLGASAKAGSELKIIQPPAGPVVEKKPIRIAAFQQAMEQAGMWKDIEAGKGLASRRAYGVALLALAEADPRVVGLDADVKNSTFAEILAKKRPQQFLECRIAEQNMISAAAGLSAAGKIPFCSTFAKFVMRGYDQLEMAIIGGANFKVTGSHAGVTLAADGPSQMSLPDVAFFRSFCHVTNYNGQPAVRYFFPSDAVSCYRLTELMANLHGCCYQRTLRADLPLLYKPDDADFEAGGFRVLREGRDVCLVAAGYMVHECLKAADELAKHGRKACVIDAYSLPMQTDKLLKHAEKCGGQIVTVEDNYTGGVDAEIAMAIASTGAPVRLKNLVVRQVPKSGRSPQDVLDYLELGAKAIVKAVG